MSEIKIVDYFSFLFEFFLTILKLFTSKHKTIISIRLFTVG